MIIFLNPTLYGLWDYMEGLKVQGRVKVKNWVIYEQSRKQTAKWKPKTAKMRKTQQVKNTKNKVKWRPLKQTKSKDKLYFWDL